MYFEIGLVIVFNIRNLARGVHFLHQPHAQNLKFSHNRYTYSCRYAIDLCKSFPILMEHIVSDEPILNWVHIVIMPSSPDFPKFCSSIVGPWSIWVM